MKRSAIRDFTFKLLYSMEIQKDWSEEQIKIYIENNNIEDKDAVNYITDVVTGIKGKSTEILDLISANLKTDWQIERISKVNLSLLKLAIYEILYKQLPYKVVINEVIELAKVYGEDSAPSFVNGILASIVKQKGIADK